MGCNNAFAYTGRVSLELCGVKGREEVAAVDTLLIRRRERWAREEIVEMSVICKQLIMVY